MHGLFWSNYALRSYEKGTNTGGTGAYAASNSYEVKLVLKAVGAQYSIKGGSYGAWTQVKETSTLSDSPLRLAFTQVSHQATIHSLKVKDVVTDSGISLGAVETSGCGNFSQIGIVSGNLTSYSDLTAPPSTESRYRVRAFKSSSCPWDSGYSNIASDLAFPAASTSLTATALNSRMIRLNWDENAADEDGYEVEIQVWNGRFKKIADLPANSDSFVDTLSIQGETGYTYRVRPYRGADIAPYSNPASVTTPAYVVGDGTCPP